MCERKLVHEYNERKKNTWGKIINISNKKTYMKKILRFGVVHEVLIKPGNTNICTQKLQDSRNQVWLRGLSLPNLARVIQTGHLMHKASFTMQD